MFLYESNGIPLKNKENGYYWGKKHMDVTLEMWKTDLKTGLLFKHELYEDEKFPKWWLDKVL